LTTAAPPPLPWTPFAPFADSDDEIQLISHTEHIRKRSRQSASTTNINEPNIDEAKLPDLLEEPKPKDTDGDCGDTVIDEASEDDKCDTLIAILDMEYEPNDSQPVESTPPRPTTSDRTLADSAEKTPAHQPFQFVPSDKLLAMEEQYQRTRRCLEKLRPLTYEYDERLPPDYCDQGCDFDSVDGMHDDGIYTLASNDILDMSHAWMCPRRLEL